MAFRNPVSTAAVGFQDSYSATEMIQHSIKNHNKLNIFEHNENAGKTLKIAKDFKKMKYEVISEGIIDNFQLIRREF